MERCADKTGEGCLRKEDPFTRGRPRSREEVRGWLVWTELGDEREVER